MNTILRLEESKGKIVPANFERLVQGLFEERSSVKSKGYWDTFDLQNDLLVCVLVTVALEEGFRYTKPTTHTRGFDRKAMLTETTFPNCREFSTGMYTVKLYLPTLPTFKFVVSPGTEETVVNFLTFCDKGRLMGNRAMCIALRRYVNPYEYGVYGKFNKLGELCGRVKDLIRAPKDLSLNDEGLPSSSLLGMPREVVEKIILFLPVKSFLHLSMTCRKMSEFRHHEAIWRSYLSRDFNIDLYEKEYETYKERFISVETVRYIIDPDDIHPNTRDTSFEFLDLPFDAFHLSEG